MKKRVLIALVVVLALAATASLVWASSLGLVSYWPFDEGSGTTAYDAVNGNDGVHGVTYSVDKAPVPSNQYALSFDGSSYVRVPNSSALEPSEVTVAAWVKAPSSPGSCRYIVAKGAQYCQAASYGLYTGGSGGLFFYIFNGSTAKLSPGAAASVVWDGTWHHVAGTYNGSAVRLYVDGFEIGTGTATNISIGYGLPSNNDLLVGAYQDSCYLPFTGLIDEVGVWNRALSADEVAALSVGVGSLEWLPPIILTDWTLNENATLPIKFQLYGPAGNLITDDLSADLTLTVTQGGSTFPDLRFDTSEWYYIANFRPTQSGLHTAIVSLDGAQLGSQPFVVDEPGKGNGKGRGSNN